MRRACSSLLTMGLLVLAGCGDPNATGSDATSPAPETTTADTSPLPDMHSPTTTSILTDTSTSTAITTSVVEAMTSSNPCVDATTQLAPSTAIVAGMHLLSDSEWAGLVSAVEQP